jgi:oxygen-dependent protoporphyrinogen oxidase
VDVAVVGGGISGLAAAYAVHRAGLAVRLLEAEGRLGGVIRTDREDGYLLERGPDNVLAQKPAWRELCDELGLGPRLVPASVEKKAVWLLRNDRLLRFPEGMGLAVPTRIAPFVRSPLFSWPGKARMAFEPLVARATGDDESVAAFLRRRLGEEAVERLGQPLLAGIHAADAERLSLRAAFPMLADMEARHGSLLKAARAAARAPRPAGAAFYTLSEGLEELVRAVAAALPPGAATVRAPVRRLQRSAGGWILSTPQGHVRARAVILAVPPAAAAALLQARSAAAAPLSTMRAASSVVALLGFRRADILHPLDGHGLVAVRGPLRRVSACSFVSTKFPGRAPEGRVLLRVFFGGANDEEIVDHADDAIVDWALHALDPVLRIRRWPVLARVHRWRRAMPQMDVGHLARVADVEAALADAPGLFLAGAGLRVTGIPDCIADGRRVAALAAAYARALAPAAP